MTMGQLDFFSRLLSTVVSPPKPLSKNGATRLSRLDNSEDSALTAVCAEMLRKLGCSDLADQVRVRWSGRMRSTAGMAYPTKRLIKLNPRLHAFGPGEIEQTLKHELAHLLAHHRAGRRRISPHGPEWRKACTDLGLVNERRCHDLPLPRRQMTRRHLYQCPGCGLAVHRVRPMRRLSACLPCCRKHNGGRYDERFRFVKLKQAGTLKV
jgi:SprT protein